MYRLASVSSLHNAVRKGNFFSRVRPPVCWGGPRVTIANLFKLVHLWTTPTTWGLLGLIPTNWGSPGCGPPHMLASQRLVSDWKALLFSTAVGRAQWSTVLRYEIWCCLLLFKCLNLVISRFRSCDIIILSTCYSQCLDLWKRNRDFGK